MNRKILWLGLSLIMVAALVLASCGPAAPGEQEEEEEEEEEAGLPQYGGTVNAFLWYVSKYGVSTFDAADASNSTMIWSQPYMERLMMGDVEKYGPRGTNEFPFTNMEYVPRAYLRGLLAESWEVTTNPLGVIFHLRPGIMWTGNEHIGMEPRELVASDVVFSLENFKANPQGERLRFVESIYALDKYTVVVEFLYMNNEWDFLLGSGLFAGIYPPEVVEADMADWENQVGTGPFILTDFVDDSYMSFERNPNYWDTTTIDGVEYQMPFIDEWVFPIIFDETSQIAAVRTGAFDINMEVAVIDARSLDETSPELIKYRRLKAAVPLVVFQTKNPMLTRDVRRALMIGTDTQAILEATMMEGEIHSFPLNSQTGPKIYTPIDELPAETRVLFGYDPVEAKRLLSLAGYPDGFLLELIVPPTPSVQDAASMIVEMWKDLDVTVTLKTVDGVQIGDLRFGKDYADAYMDGTGNSILLTHPSIGVKGLLENSSQWEDDYYTDLFHLAEQEMDLDKMMGYIKELCVRINNEVPYIPLGSPYFYTYTWPWVKNYYGEIETGFFTISPMISTLWIDQDLKADMGY